MRIEARVSAFDLASSIIKNHAYEEIIDFIMLIDELQQDSGFTYMLKNAVDAEFSRMESEFSDS